MPGMDEQSLWDLRSHHNGRTGYIDRSGNWAIEPRFDQAYAFDGDRAAAVFQGRWGALDRKGQWTHAPGEVSHISTYGEGPLRAQVGQKWGLLDERGRWIAQPQFTFIRGFSNDRCVAMHDGLYGCLDANFRWIIEPRFQYLGAFCRGLAVAKLPGGSYGYIDENANWIIQPQFSTAHSFQGDETDTAVVGLRWKDGSYQEGYIDRGGRWFIEPSFKSASGFKQGAAVCSREDPGDPYPLDWPCGLIDTSGEWVVEPRFENLWIAGDDLFAAKHDGCWGFIDRCGNWLLEPVLDMISHVEDGLIEAADDRRGILSRAFEWVVDPIYDAVEIRGELISAVYFGRQCYLDRNGKSVTGWFL